MLPHFELHNCIVIPWKTSEQILKFLNIKEVTHCAYAIAVSKSGMPRIDVLPYENESTIYIGSTGGDITADRKCITKNKYKVYTLPHVRMKDHMYGFKNPKKVSEEKYSIALEHHKIININTEIYYSLIIPQSNVTGARRKSLSILLEYEHIDAYINLRGHEPIMNREFANTTRNSESLARKHIEKCKQNNTLLPFVQ
jgi:hypothetical protein